MFQHHTSIQVTTTLVRALHTYIHTYIKINKNTFKFLRNCPFDIDPMCWVVLRGRRRPLCCAAFVSSVDADMASQSKTGCSEPSTVGGIGLLVSLSQTRLPAEQLAKLTGSRQALAPVLLGCHQRSVCQCAPVPRRQHKLGWFDVAPVQVSIQSVAESLARTTLGPLA